MMSSLLPVVLLFESAAPANLLPEVRRAIDRNEFEQAETRLRDFRAKHGATPELLEALSWLGRGELAAHRLEAAGKHAAEVQQLVEERLKTEALDANNHLVTALGAAIEVLGQMKAQQGDRTGAVEYLTTQLERYRATSIRVRIQKNLHLLNLVGKPAPPIEGFPLSSLKGRPVVLFFWAHWCPDCKQQAPDLARLLEKFHDRRLKLVMPTQHYGSVARGEAAPPDKESAYIDQVRHKYYGALLSAPAPMSEETFRLYGCSTVPTIVLVDRAGIVRLYHPGQMSYEELAHGVEALR